MKVIVIICFGILMAGLGAGDALRGIYAPVFRDRYLLSESQLSVIMVVSYIGNLLFLSIGGRLLDTFRRRRIVILTVSIWIAAAAVNFLTDNYVCILITMFFSLGASTLLNTTINILTPAMCAGYAGLMVNVFFFLQGMGTSAGQYGLVRYAFSYSGWNGINAVLCGAGLLVLVLLCFIHVPEKSEDQKDPAGRSGPEPGRWIFWMLAAIFGCYFIGEHGIMNWMLSYCIGAFAMDAGQASVSVSLFWGGMTAGRLIFAPGVQRLGTVKSLGLFGGVGTVMFCAGCLLGQKGIWILGLSGFVISILYPTMVLLIQQIYPPETAATRTGAIISIATIADIGFNVVFGMAAGRWGYRLSFMILPVSMAVFYILYLNLVKRVSREW